MAGALSVSVRLSPSWRDAVGRFSRPPVGEAIDRGLYPLGQDAVRLLAQATPVRTGRMRASWRSTLVPRAHQLRVTNQASYAPYVIWGTRYMPANADLQRVLHTELPTMAQVMAGKTLRAISLQLKGQG
jgi:hypothetical protein